MRPYAVAELSPWIPAAAARNLAGWIRLGGLKGTEMDKANTYPVMALEGQGQAPGLSDDEKTVLRHIDGNTSISALAGSTGFGEQKLRRILHRLGAAGAIRFYAVPQGPASSPSSGPRVKTATIDESPQPNSVRAPKRERAPMSLLEINPDDLEPTIEIELKTQKEILQLEGRLRTEDHYALLGVSREAEKKEIKSAYFDLMNRFHTDKFYGKRLGGFERRLQHIIEALTKANDVLGRKKTRAEYDEYLSSRETTQGARESMIPAMPSLSLIHI